MRCSWCSNELLSAYHDQEWCQITALDDRYLFELLVLESMQAGLSWEIILKRRKAYRRCFDDFDYLKISKYPQSKLDELYHNSEIIRHRLKIDAIVNNAQKFITVINEFGSFYHYLLTFTKQEIFILDAKITSNQLSLNISKDLKKRGFKFIGEKIIYAYLQAIGIINSHEKGCKLYVGE